MSVHAFLDESQRDRLYLVSVAVVDPARLVELRKQMRALLLPGQRELHISKEREGRRKKIADAVAGMAVEVHVYSRQCPTRSRASVEARRACLSQLTTDLLARGARRMVLDSRESQDADDRHTIQTVLGGHPSATGLVYEHLNSRSEELLWIADICAWCYGAGGQWRQRISPVIAGEVLV